MRRPCLVMRTVVVVRRAAVVMCVAITIALPCGAHAQKPTAVQSAIDRARAMVDAGNGGAARTLLDSLVGALPNSDDVAEVLYWRAVFNENAADAELDWKRLMLESPLSPRVPEALLRLGEGALVRGSSVDARAYLERLLRNYSDVVQRPKAMLGVARSYFDERDVPHACAIMSALKGADVPEGELLLQAAELRGRCAKAAAVTTIAPTATNTALTAINTAPVANAKKDTSSTPTAASSRRLYSVQIAAYDTRAQATAVVKRMQQRGISARIDGDRKPFRVRVGRYHSRADAVASLAKLKKHGQSGFVAEIES